MLQIRYERESNVNALLSCSGYVNSDRQQEELADGVDSAAG